MKSVRLNWTCNDAGRSDACAVSYELEPKIRIATHDLAFKETGLYVCMI